MADSFYWHDYETWGAVPARDRPCQFAGLRTDAALNPIGEPLVLFARPADDLLPQPDACLVTGITPQRALQEGLPEAEFAAAIRRELAVPGTCGVGYNSLRFDDEVTRHLFYRNLLDPYAHAWRDGNSRWDLIDALRLAHALRPDGIHWPEREPGVTSFRLEELTAANQIPHAGAHDALADVRATLDLARLLKRAQPRLFDYALTLRKADVVRARLDKGEAVLHVSQRYPAARGCIAPVAVVGEGVDNPKQRYVFDLREDPAQLLELDLEALRARLFTAPDELPEGVERLPLKGLKVNACPMIAPLGTLADAAAERWGIDRAVVARHAAVVAAHRDAIHTKVRAVFDGRNRPEPTDPELMLYSGGFFSDADRRRMDHLSGLSPAALAAEQPRFDDPRLPTLLFRMRARSWPETLSEAEREDWDAWRFERLTDPDAGASITVEGYEARLTELRDGLAAGDAEQAERDAKLAVLDALAAWGEQVMDAAV